MTDNLHDDSDTANTQRVPHISELDIDTIDGALPAHRRAVERFAECVACAAAEAQAAYASGDFTRIARAEVVYHNLSKSLAESQRQVRELERQRQRQLEAALVDTVLSRAAQIRSLSVVRCGLTRPRAGLLRASRRTRVVARVAAKATATGDPDGPAEPPGRRAPQLGGVAW